MSDILIPNMEMPRKCFDCGFCYDGDRIRYCLATPWQKEIRKEVFPKRREDFCPLVELPPHGRLCDLDALIEHETYNIKQALFDSDEVLEDLKNAPVIVEATE